MRFKYIYKIFLVIINLIIISSFFVKANNDVCSNDTIAPMIIDAKDLIFEVGDLNPNYRGDVTLTDNCDSNPSLVIDDTHIDINSVGKYPLIYHASDYSGNSVDEVVYVLVKEDIILPTIEGMTDKSFEVNSEITNEMILNGIFAEDNKDGNITSLIQINKEGLNNNLLGDYQITYEVIDSSDNKTITEGVISIIDTMAPVIECNGEINIEVHSTVENWIDYFNISDNYDDNPIVTFDVDSVDLTRLGSYEINVTAIDNEGNEAIESVNVLVSDQIKPKVDIIDHISVDVFSEEVDYLNYISVSDNYDDIPIINIDKSNVNLNEIGEYIVFITVTDSSNNVTTEEINVFVVDCEAPTIGNLADFNYVVGENTPNYLIDITVTDNYDQNISSDNVIVIDNYINYNQAGNFPLLYKVMDNSNNITINIVTVNVSFNDIKAPDLFNLKDLYISSSNFDPDLLHNILAIDDIDGDITDKVIVIDSEVKYGVCGDYSLSYYVSDNSGNSTVKTVNVFIKADATKPEIIGATNRSINVGDNFDVIEGIEAIDNLDGDITPNIRVLTSYDVNKPGLYNITLKVSDSSGNTQFASYKLEVNGNEDLLMIGGITVSVVLVLVGVIYLVYKKHSFKE